MLTLSSLPFLLLSLLTFICPGEAKNIPPYPGPNRMRDCYCTVNLDQEEVFRTKIVEKSLWYVKFPPLFFFHKSASCGFPDF